MMKIFLDNQKSVSECWSELKSYLLDRILIGFLVLSIFGLPISLSRAISYGWQSIYSVQLLTAICIFILYFARHQLSFTFKLRFLVFSLFILSFLGLANFGLAGGGVAFLILLHFLIASFYRPSIGLLGVITSSLLFMVVALGFISGRLGIHVDFNAYITNPSAWMSVWMLFSVISIIAFRAMGVMQHTLLVLLKEIERQRDEIHHLANHDHLTGLPTMRLAQDRLEMAVHHAERNQEKVALLFIDLDGFKKVNDQLGHDCGDYALQEVAQRMVKIVRPDDTVARRSGDEFLIILEGVTDPNYSTSIARAIITTIKQPMTYQGQSFTLGASVGISIFPDHTRNLDHLKYLADQAMYTVKHHQKNDFSVSQVWSDLPLKPS